MLPTGVKHRPGRRAFLVLLVPVLLLAGCRNTRQELVESELRARERDVRELREEVGRLECHNEALQRELGGTYQGGPRLPPEVAAQTYTLHRISLGRGTGGLDQDHQLGDEALQVVLEPRDGADHIIKAPGTLSVTALEINPEGLKTPFSSWTVPPEQLRQSWHTGFFTTGYVLALPWQAPPHSPQVRVIARLQTDDGRLFETDRDVRVVLRPDIMNEKMPVPVPVIPSVPQPGTPLPMPRPLGVPPDAGPILPSASARVPLDAAAGWQAPPLDDAVQLGQPTAGDPEP
jgi:hypothetical protein